MVCGPIQAAKRALVNVICALAQVYDVRVSCSRDSPDGVVLKDFRRLALKAHPDRGGQVEHQQQLNDARMKWEKALRRVRRILVWFLLPPALTGLGKSFASILLLFCSLTRELPVSGNGSDSMLLWLLG